MADYEIKRRASIGIPSLILIFIVLCLAAFSILSLGNAGREDSFSRKNAAAVQEYYRADALGEEFLQRLDRAVAETSGIEDSEMRRERVLASLGLTENSGAENVSPDQTGMEPVSVDIPMDAGLALRVGVRVDWEKDTWEVVRWTVFDRENYEIDQSVPVWIGDRS